MFVLVVLFFLHNILDFAKIWFSRLSSRSSLNTRINRFDRYSMEGIGSVCNFLVKTLSPFKKTKLLSEPFNSTEFGQASEKKTVGFKLTQP